MTQCIPVQDNRAVGAIVLPDGANRIEQYIADDLRYVLHQMTGARLPVVSEPQSEGGSRVLIGNTERGRTVVSDAERSDLGREGYVLREREGDLVLLGGEPDSGESYGTAHAYAELLSFLGARFYLPGEMGECIPERTSVELSGLNVRRTPSFRMRWVGKDPRWAIRNGQNYVETPELPSSFTIYPSVFHSQETLLPDDPFFHEHPEFFALVDGERSENARVRKLCNSNDRLPGVLAEQFARVLRTRPEIDMISLSPTDGQHWCECAECRALDEPGVPDDQKYSRRQMILYNRVAEELAKEFPDVMILVGAYNTYTWPPADPSVRAHRNIAVMICHYEDYCLAHPVDDPDCDPNRRYVALIEAWKQHTNHIYFYEYYHKANWIDLPWPIAHTVKRDIPYFHSIGVEGLFTQWREDNIFSNFIPHYVAARLLFDVETDADRLLDELYEGFYGVAAEPMRRFHEGLGRHMETCGRHLPGHAPKNAQYIFTPEIVEMMKSTVAEAERLVSETDGGGTGRVARRIERTRVLVDYTTQLARYYTLRRQAREEQGERRLELLKEAYEIATAVSADVLGNPEKYRFVASGHYMTGRFIMVRDIERLRQTIENGGVPPDTPNTIGVPDQALED